MLRVEGKHPLPVMCYMPDAGPVVCKITQRRTARDIVHEMEFNREVRENDVRFFVKATGHFGYHPAGYGGKLSGSGKNWSWSCASSCD